MLKWDIAQGIWIAQVAPFIFFGLLIVAVCLGWLLFKFCEHLGNAIHGGALMLFRWMAAQFGITVRADCRLLVKP